MHLLVGVVCGRILHDGDIVTEFSGKAYGRLDAGMRYQSDDDKLMDAAFLELEVQICVGEAAGTPMSPASGSNSGRISPPQVPYSKVFRSQAAF